MSGPRAPQGVERAASRLIEAGEGLLQRVTGERGRSEAAATEAERAVTVDRPAEELGRVWQAPGTLTRITTHLGERGATPRARRPGGRRPAGRPPTLRPGAELPVEGTLRFRPAPNEQGTEVVLRLRLAGPPVPGIVARAVAARTLREFKALAETGEIPTLERNPAARPGDGDAV